MPHSNVFLIAGHQVCIRFADTTVNSMTLLPSFGAFQCCQESDDFLFTLTVDDTIRPAANKKPVRKFDTGNGDTLVYQLPDGGYQFIIRDIHDRDCCLLIANSDFSDCRCALNGDWLMRSFGLNDALMLAYAFAGLSAHHADSCLYHHASWLWLSVYCPEWYRQEHPFLALAETYRGLPADER